MKKSLITIFAVAVTVIAMAAGTKLWVYSHSGNHFSVNIADFDSLSFVEPGLLEISPIEKKIGNEGGRFTLEITANKPWTASSNDPAVILGTTQGTGNAKIACTAMPNTEEEPYTAIITVTLEDGTYKQALVTVGKDKADNHPTVAPTIGLITIAFKVPELSCGYNDIVINMFGDFQGNSPNDPDAPVAVSLNDPNYPDWYKVTFPAYNGDSYYGGAAYGKLCPRKSVGAGTWDYQAMEFEILEGPGERIPDFGDAIRCNEGSVGGVIYVNVSEWSEGWCGLCSGTNNAGIATFMCRFDIPEEVNTDDITLTVEGMNDVLDWGYVAALTYNKYDDSWSATAEVPAAFLFKFVIRYKGGNYVYQKGDNNAMPCYRDVYETDIEWDEDPFVERGE